MPKVILVHAIRRSGSHFCCQLIASNYLQGGVDLPLARRGVCIQNKIYFRDDQRRAIRIINRIYFMGRVDLILILFESCLHTLNNQIALLNPEVRSNTYLVVVDRSPVSLMASSLRFNQPSIANPNFIIQNWEHYHNLSQQDTYEGVKVIRFDYDKYRDTNYIREFLNQLDIEQDATLFGLDRIPIRGGGSSFFHFDLNKIHQERETAILEYHQHPTMIELLKQPFAKEFQIKDEQDEINEIKDEQDEN